jgi:uncharacterized Rossmann fold enzyme
MSCVINHSKTTRIAIPTKCSLCQASNIASILSSSEWQGKRCFIIGGGPSLENFGFHKLDGELTIGVNKAFTAYPPTINYAMDLRFYDALNSPDKKDLKAVELYNKWVAYKGIKVFLKRSEKTRFDSGIYVVNSLPSKTISFDLKKGIWGGNNSGFGALMLAVALGSKKIGLLGLDMKIDEKKSKTHWHEGYPDQTLMGFPKKLGSFSQCFEEFAASIMNNGITVDNLNPDSALGCFNKSTFDSFIKES